MNFSENVRKLKKASNIDFSSVKQMVEEFSPLEFHFMEDNKESDSVFIPNEPNFQIPNIFIRAIANTSVKKFIKDNKETRNYSETIDKVLEELETIDMTVEEHDNNMKEDVDEKMLNSLLSRRFGISKDNM